MTDNDFLATLAKLVALIIQKHGNQVNFLIASLSVGYYILPAGNREKLKKLHLKMDDTRRDLNSLNLKMDDTKEGFNAFPL